MERKPDREFRRDQDDHRIAMICLVDVPHPTIPNLFQRCFEYWEPWQWSPETERVQTGLWFFAPRARMLPEPPSSKLLAQPPSS